MFAKILKKQFLHSFCQDKNVERSFSGVKRKTKEKKRKRKRLKMNLQTVFLSVGAFKTWIWGEWCNARIQEKGKKLLRCQLSTRKKGKRNGLCCIFGPELDMSVTFGAVSPCFCCCVGPTDFMSRRGVLSGYSGPGTFTVGISMVG
jgi:hypothetical protein